jgi:1-deoxy-D-xylulose-5-phosphate reductoisomerase
LTNLEFFNPDLEKFPLLGLAYEALNKGGASPTILNAANEVAVQSFIDGKIPFLGISKVVSKALEELSSESLTEIKDIFRVDKIARDFSNDYIKHV